MSEHVHEPVAPLPDKVVTMLREGNMRYVQGVSLNTCALLARWRATVCKEPRPKVAILSCSDSRVPMEMIFDLGIGEAFVVRVAGNVCGPLEVASIEFSVLNLEVPLLVVLGHSECGAVTTAVLGEAAGGSIPGLLERIGPALEHARGAHPGAGPEALIREVIKANVWQSIAELQRQSQVLSELVCAGHLKIIGGIYDIREGRVEWLGSHPQETGI